MTELLIFTNSADGTSDILVDLFKKRNLPLFRWNIDLWQHYEILMSERDTLISDPLGRSISISNPNLFLLWRKPFVEQMNFDHSSLGNDDEDMARIQIAKWMQSIVALMNTENRIRLIEPYADQRLPKLFQLQVAVEYFLVPKSLFSLQAGATSFGPSMITKPLGNPSIGKESIFYTRLVNGLDLYRPYPWFVQEALVGGVDITCVFINGKSHFFKCDYLRDKKSIDWRVEINTEQQSKWHPISSKDCKDWGRRVKAYMLRLGLHYGRLDFIHFEDKLFFLECNTNGQFGWLDSADNMTLHNEFADAVIDSGTSTNLFFKM